MLALMDRGGQGAAMRVLLALVLAAGLLGVCSPAGKRQLQKDLQAQGAAQADLQRRLDEFEAQLTAVQLSTSGQVELQARLAAAEQRLADVDRRLGDLNSRLDADDEAQEAAAEELRGAVSELRKTVQELNPKVSGLQRAVGDLTSRLNLLAQRFTNHTRHPPG